MATAAFKSNSRRGNAIPSPENSGSPNVNNNFPPLRRRRSLSVSAVSRTGTQSLQEIPSEFCNKRDNPLFWSKEIEPGDAGGIGDSAGKGSVGVGLTSESVTSGQRGRSVTKNSGVGTKKEVGQSLSRVDTGGRGRSVSRGHYAASESEVEQEPVISSSSRIKSDLNVIPNGVSKVSSARYPTDRWGLAKGPRTKASQHPPAEVLDDSASRLRIPNWDDGVSTASLSEAEEKTIKAVCEQMKSYRGDHFGGDDASTGIYETVRSEVRRAIADIQNDLENSIKRSNATAISTTDVADIPPDLVNPGAVELVLDIRREYARKLEESQERARKLRADLAVEEHRGQELSRILKEILPDPKATLPQRSRLGRRSSNERKKMSKRLAEEAKAYFDECVSISTFDSSDFSASEELPFYSVGTTIPVDSTASALQGSPFISVSNCSNNSFHHKQESGGHAQVMCSHEDSSLTAYSSSGEQMIDQVIVRGSNTEWGQKSLFSCGNKPTEILWLQEDIKSYIKNFEKDSKDGINPELTRSNYYDVDDYMLRGHKESLLFDRFFLNDRIESGGLHLCGGGGVAVSFYPFASVI